MIVCRMFTTLCLRFSQHEIAWAYVIFVARVLECTQQLFAQDGTPLWVVDGHALDFPRLEGAPSTALCCLHAWPPPSVFTSIADRYNCSKGSRKQPGVAAVASYIAWS